MPELSLQDPKTVRTLGRLLVEQGYTGEGVQTATRAAGVFVTPTATDVPVVLRQLRGTPRLNELIKLLLLNVPMSEQEAAAAFDPVSVEGLVGLGVLVRGADGTLEAPVRFVPHNDLLFVCDRFEQELLPEALEYVAPPNPSSLSLEALTIRRPVASTLDVGTGFGIQALRAASHSGRVVACDLNPRAVNFAAFSAQLNGIENVEFRTGSLFEPVAGERFELVLCNPPYVISPESEFLYRDSGQLADAMCEQIVREAPAHLEEGGIAQVLASWVVEDPDADWATRPRAWVEGTGCDAFIFHFKTESPLDTATLQRRVMFSQDPDYIAGTLDRWLEYYERIGARALGYGALVLRKRSGAENWLRTEMIAMSRAGIASEHLLRLIDATDELAARADSELLEERLRLADAHVMEERLAVRAGAWEVLDAQLTLQQGLGFTGSVDPTTVRLLPLCNGERTVREAIAVLAESVGMHEPPEDLERFIAAGLPMVRRLYELGFLVPADGR